VTAYAVYSPGWGITVVLGEGQKHALAQLKRAARKHPSRTWHDVPTMRAFDRAPSTAHRLVHALVSRGVVAIQAALPQHGPRKSQGCHGGLRFTMGVKRWRMDEKPRRSQLARMTAGQLVLVPDWSADQPKPAEIPKPPETAPPERPRTPETGESDSGGQSEFTRGMVRAGWRGWGPQ
jgi:hypothetical protein